MMPSRITTQNLFERDYYFFSVRLCPRTCLFFGRGTVCIGIYCFYPHLEKMLTQTAAVPESFVKAVVADEMLPRKAKEQ